MSKKKNKNLKIIFKKVSFFSTEKSEKIVSKWSDTYLSMTYLQNHDIPSNETFFSQF